MAGLVFHVINRSAKRGPLLQTSADYDGFVRTLRDALAERPLGLLNFCAMPTHFHLLAQPATDTELSRFMHWFTATHAMRWRKSNDTVGEGAVYQGRYKAIPVHTEDYFLAVARYVERNPLRAKLVTRVEDWQWSSLYHRDIVKDNFPLAQWPIAQPEDWIANVNEPQTVGEIAAIRRSVHNGCALGNASWQEEVAKTLGIPGYFRSRGRPRRNGS